MKDSDWVVLIADDEKDVHTITHMVCSDFKFEDNNVSFIDSYSAKETIEMIRDNKVSALILDMIMENDYSGIDVINEIRDNMLNIDTRIILRSGNIVNHSFMERYNINGCIEKHNTDSTSLKNSILFALRGYRDIINVGGKNGENINNITTIDSN